MADVHIHFNALAFLSSAPLCIVNAWPFHTSVLNGLANPENIADIQSPRGDPVTRGGPPPAPDCCRPADGDSEASGAQAEAKATAPAVPRASAAGVEPDSSVQMDDELQSDRAIARLLQEGNDEYLAGPAGHG